MSTKKAGSTRTTGYKTEEIAKNYLTKKGYKFIASNVQQSHQEIDLIMQDGEFLVFIEVKSLNENSLFSIYETLTKKKKLFLRKAILGWLNKNNLHDAIWRFDFVGLLKSGGLYKIEHSEFVEL